MTRTKLMLAMALVMAALVASAPGASARPLKGVAVAQRGGRPVTLSFHAKRAGEALVDLAASAKGVDWAHAGAESAVVSVTVDGRYATDLVIFSETPMPRRLALGHVGAGRHTLELRFASDRSPAAAKRAKIEDLSVQVVPATDPSGLALRHAPVLFGRRSP